MATKPQTYTARPKRASDGAVSARYRQEKPEKAAAEKKPAARQAAEKKTTERKPAAKKPAAAQTAEKKQTAQRAPVRRVVMADEKTARRVNAEKRREPARTRREKARAEAAMRDRRRAVSRGIDMSVT
ncbi:MAG: hypothetical protein IKU73_01810, partial [Clostridia bacterium]|nr:hypothetical protein [Clostridia bacterium]